MPKNENDTDGKRSLKKRRLEQNDVEQEWQTFCFLSKIFIYSIIWYEIISTFITFSLPHFLTSLLLILILHFPLWFHVEAKQLFGEKSRLWTLAGDWKAGFSGGTVGGTDGPWPRFERFSCWVGGFAFAGWVLRWCFCIRCLPLFCCQNQYDAWKKDDIWRKDEHSRFNAEEMNKKVLMWEKVSPSLDMCWVKRCYLPNLCKICWNVQARFLYLSSAQCRSWNSPKLPINSRPWPRPLTFMAEMWRKDLAGPAFGSGCLFFKSFQKALLVFDNTKLGTGKQLMGETWTDAVGKLQI